MRSNRFTDSKRRPNNIQRIEIGSNCRNILKNPAYRRDILNLNIKGQGQRLTSAEEMIDIQKIATGKRRIILQRAINHKGILDVFKTGIQRIAHHQV